MCVWVAMQMQKMYVWFWLFIVIYDIYTHTHFSTNNLRMRKIIARSWNCFFFLRFGRQNIFCFFIGGSRASGQNRLSFLPRQGGRVGQVTDFRYCNFPRGRLQLYIPIIISINIPMIDIPMIIRWIFITINHHHHGSTIKPCALRISSGFASFFFWSSTRQRSNAKRSLAPSRSGPGTREAINLGIRMYFSRRNVGFFCFRNENPGISNEDLMDLYKYEGYEGDSSIK